MSETVTFEYRARSMVAILVVLDRQRENGVTYTQDPPPPKRTRWWHWLIPHRLPRSVTITCPVNFLPRLRADIAEEEQLDWADRNAW
ncbi:MAG TPA: hypothetical protein VF522_19150 [Ramlibacter sp.]|uniref:hypothetical protein n=1 Tax=Ramlibacter sp. TaxID=1917967 RepID=UPI002ED08EE4